MNLILMTSDELRDNGGVRLADRRYDHIRAVLKPQIGDRLRVGVVDGLIGTGRVDAMGEGWVDLTVTLTTPPPEPWPLTLLLALPRPKSFRRTLQCAVTMGVSRIALFGAYRVERSYWRSPWLADPALAEQVTLGLEQAGATCRPTISMHPLFKPFIEDVAPGWIRNTRRLVAHPREAAVCPCAVPGPLTLAIGPEGGFTDYELGRFLDLGFEPVALGARVLRTEQAVPAFLGRLLPA